MVNSITTDQLAIKLGVDKINLIDVREAYEYVAGHIKGSKHCPLSRFSQVVEQLNPAQVYYVLCQTGTRSANASEYLSSQGYDVVNVMGGMNHWKGEIESGM